MAYTIKKIQKRLEEKYPEENLKFLEWRGIKNPCKIKCLSCGKIYSYKSADNIFSKRKKILCHDCRDNIVRKKRFQQSLADSFPEDRVEVIDYKNKTSPCRIRCKRCGKEYYFAEGRNALRKTRKYFCSKCFPFKIDAMIETKERFLDFLSSSPQWELAQSLEGVHSNDIIKCKCKICGEITGKTISDYLRGRGCIICCGHKLKTTEEFQQELEEGYKILSPYIGANSKILLEHSCGLKFYTTPHKYLSGTRCPSCSRKHSRGEEKIKNFLIKNGIEYESEYPINIEGHWLRIDFFLPEFNKYIEFQGQQHYYAVDFFGGEQQLKKQQHYDQLKRDYLQDKLLEIPYDEIDNIPFILEKALKFND